MTNAARCWSVTDSSSWLRALSTRSDGLGGRFAPFSFGGAQTPFVKALKDSFALRVP